MSSNIVNMISVSGGKDSTAMLLLALERGVENIVPVFADTGNELKPTYEYLVYLDDYLQKKHGLHIRRVKASFDRQIANKRLFIARDTRHGRDKNGKRLRWSNKAKRRALSVLHPTGNPFLDLCLWKGRFPSTRRRFCSQELKHVAIHEQAVKPLMKKYDCLISWQGVRRDESEQRRVLPERDVEFGSWEPSPSGLLVYRPIIDWTVTEVFDMHRRHDVRWNPLYEDGMSRVGCVCIHSKKSEMQSISTRYPNEITRLDEWERLVSMASKRGCSTFMDARVTAKFLGTDTRAQTIHHETHGIRAYAEWAKTARGGRQYDLIASIGGSQCSSVYGLCE